VSFLVTLLQAFLCMTSPQPLPGDKPPIPVSLPAGGDDADSAHGLVPATQPQAEDEAVEQSSPVLRLPVEVDVTVPVRQFRVRDLLAIEPGRLIESQWANGEDLPLLSGEVQLAWSEFEVIDTQLAVRVTRLA
jgi:flagellar motor switch/type III secretory pathway protein FliN